ncbi:F0F1 ATP synthase subunit A [Candidatus Nomurabacteria bacterium]|nr:MAG: F0F1 ATP synthase subunit A [Candidatus Nomurabacteria bacterium]
MHNENEILDNETELHTTDTSHEIVHEVTIYAEPIGHIGNFTITNALLTSWIAVGIIVILAIAVRFSIKKVPSKLQTLFEVIIEQTLDLTDQITGNRAKSLKIFPIALAVFFFILINNWLGILPLGAFGLVAEHGGESAFLPFLRSGTADINTTLALAVMAVLGSNLFGILSIGAWKTFNKYVNLKAFGKVFTDVRKDPSILMVAPVMFFVGVLELVGEAAKVASLSFRLFGNVFAGEVLLASMAALLAYVLPIPFIGLEIFVGLIQALIFSMLTLVYFSIASEDHDEAHAEKH